MKNYAVFLELSNGKRIGVGTDTGLSSTAAFNVAEEALLGKRDTDDARVTQATVFKGADKVNTYLRDLKIKRGKK